jgi:hypothetical protein
MVESLLEQLSGPALGQIATQIGADQQTTGRAVSAALPALVSALARHASTEDGAAALNDTLAQGGHDGGILEDLSGFLGGGAGAAGASPGLGGIGDLLGQVMGGRQASINDTLGRGTGLDAATMGRLFTVLAPIVLGAIGRAASRTVSTPAASAASSPASTPRCARRRPTRWVCSARSSTRTTTARSRTTSRAWAAASWADCWAESGSPRRTPAGASPAVSSWRRPEGS